MKRLSTDEDAREVLAEHIAALRPHINDTSKENDWTKTRELSTAPRLDLQAARAAAHARIRRQNLGRNSK